MTIAIATTIAIDVGVITIGVAAFPSSSSSSSLPPRLPLPPSPPPSLLLFTNSGHYE
jgi:hypothetical protein